MTTSNSTSKPSISSAHTVTYEDSSNTSRSNLSPSGTVFYSLDNSESAMDSSNNKKRPQFESLENQEVVMGLDDTTELRRKQSKIDHDQGQEENIRGISTEPVTPITPAPATRLLQELQSSQQVFTTTTPALELEDPDWSNNCEAWAFLQSLNSDYKSTYLVKRDNSSKGRSGYVLGRRKDSDITFTQSEISKSHCLIYMETGSNGKAKGIRIYLEDLSFNGTYVDGKMVGRNKRIMLRHNNEIQLFRKTAYREDDPRQKFFRILLPSSYEASRCEKEFVMTKVLGRGNFASVYHAHHYENENDQYAIKVLNKSRLQKPKQQKSIQTEIGIMMALTKHPLIVKIHRIFNEEHKLYLVLEYVPDGELFQYVVENQRLPENEVRFIFWQLFTAIKFLHSHNIAHRDIKPENILIVNKKTLHVKVSDFGLANVEQRDQSFGSQCGTPNYVAPEILDSAENRAYDKSCDLWSLGVMLYICLCGFPPFSEENAPPSMKMQIKMGKYTFISPYWDNISKAAKELVRKLLQVDPSKRMTITEALDDPWIWMDLKDIEKRQNALGKEVMNEINALDLKDSQTPTQISSPPS